LITNLVTLLRLTVILPDLVIIPEAIVEHPPAKADEFKRWGDPRQVAFLSGTRGCEREISSGVRTKNPFANSRDGGRGMKERTEKLVFCM